MVKTVKTTLILLMLSLLLPTAQLLAGSISDFAPKAHWTMDETSGVRYDSTGNVNLTDNNTVSYATGLRGNAGDFERGNSEYLSSASSTFLNVVNGWSVSYWINDESVGTDQYVIGSRNGGYGWTAGAIDTLGRLYLGSGSGTWGFSSEIGVAIVVPTTWFNVIVNFNGASTTAYVNGTLYNKSINNITSATTSFYIGKNSQEGSLDSYFDGLIDEVTIFDQNIDATEAAIIYNSGTPLPYTSTTSTSTATSTSETNSFEGLDMLTFFGLWAGSFLLGLYLIRRLT